MSGVYGLTGTAALSASTTTYLWGVISGSATSDGVITWFDVTMNAGTPATGCLVELFRCTGGGPTGTTYTANKLSSDAQTGTGMLSCWVAPITGNTNTGLVTIKQWYLSPTGGTLIQYPLSREDYIIAGTTNWFGARITTPSGVTPNIAFNVSWNE